MLNLTTILLFANIVLLIVGSLFLISRQRKAQREIEKSHAEIASLKNELQALYSGAAGVGTHLARIESQINTLSERQEQFDVHDASTLSYSEAIELVHQGATEEELMERCGLLHEEAELLIRLHKDDVANVD